MPSELSPHDCFVGTVTVGERGQLVIPAEARKMLAINTGDRLLIMTHPSQNGFMAFKIDAIRKFLNYLTAGLGVAELNKTVTQSEEESNIEGKAD